MLLYHGTHRKGLPDQPLKVRSARSICHEKKNQNTDSWLSQLSSPSPDLYGPFWTLSTLAFSLFVFSSLASSITSYLSDIPFNYDFKLLSIAVSLVYSYGLGLPTLLWLVLRYLGVSEWSLVEALAIYGYGQFIWIPVSVSRTHPLLVTWLVDAPRNYLVRGWSEPTKRHQILV